MDDTIRAASRHRDGGVAGGGGGRESPAAPKLKQSHTLMAKEWAMSPSGGGGAPAVEAAGKEFVINGIRCKMLGVYRNVDSSEFIGSLDEKKKLRIIFMVYLDSGYPTLTGQIRHWLPFYISSGSEGGSGSEGENIANPFFGMIRGAAIRDNHLMKNNLVNIHFWDEDENVVNHYDKHYATQLDELLTPPFSTLQGGLPTPLSILRYPIYKVLKDNEVPTSLAPEEKEERRKEINKKPAYRFIRRLLHSSEEDDLYLVEWIIKCGIFEEGVSARMESALRKTGRIVSNNKEEKDFIPKFYTLIENLEKVRKFFKIDDGYTHDSKQCKNTFFQIDRDLRRYGNWSYAPFNIHKQEQEYMVHIPTNTGQRISISLPLLNEFDVDFALGDNTPFGVNLTSIYDPQKVEYDEFMKVYSEFIPNGIGEDYYIQKALRLSIPTLTDILLNIIGFKKQDMKNVYESMYKNKYPDSPTPEQQTALTYITTKVRPPPPVDPDKKMRDIPLHYKKKFEPSFRWEKQRIAEETPPAASAGGGGTSNGGYRKRRRKTKRKTKRKKRRRRKRRKKRRTRRRR